MSKTINPEILIELGFSQCSSYEFHLQVKNTTVYWEKTQGFSIHAYIDINGREVEVVELGHIPLVQLKALLFGLTGQPIYYIPSQGERTKESFEETKDVYKNHSIETPRNEVTDIFDKNGEITEKMKIKLAEAREENDRDLDKFLERMKETEKLPMILTERSVNTNGWVSTKESLPPRKQVVLLWSEHRGLEIGQRSELEGNWYNDESIFLENEDVLFWCEIPSTLPFKNNQDE